MPTIPDTPLAASVTRQILDLCRQLHQFIRSGARPFGSREISLDMTLEERMDSVGRTQERLLGLMEQLRGDEEAEIVIGGALEYFDLLLGELRREVEVRIALAEMARAARAA